MFSWFFKNDNDNDNDNENNNNYLNETGKEEDNINDKENESISWFFDMFKDKENNNESINEVNNFKPTSRKFQTKRKTQSQKLIRRKRTSTSRLR
jgi:hypothetical protein